MSNAWRNPFLASSFCRAHSSARSFPSLPWPSRHYEPMACGRRDSQPIVGIFARILPPCRVGRAGYKSSLPDLKSSIVCIRIFSGTLCPARREWRALGLCIAELLGGGPKIAMPWPYYNKCRPEPIGNRDRCLWRGARTVCVQPR